VGSKLIPMSSAWRDTPARMLTPEAVAYHEAGHVVVGYEFGWWVRRGGVRLGPGAHARLQNLPPDGTLLARICVYMAGMLAEQKFHGVRWRFEEEIVDQIQAVRAGESEGARLFPTDFRAIALALLDDDPSISPRGARRAVRYCRAETQALLDQPRVWAGVERLARVLLRRRYLSPRTIKQVLGQAFFVGHPASRPGAAVPARASRLRL